MAVHVLVWANIQADSSDGMTRLKDVIETLIRQGRWFVCEPWPCGYWRVSVHDEPGAKVVFMDHGLEPQGGRK